MRFDAALKLNLKEEEEENKKKKEKEKQKKEKTKRRMRRNRRKMRVKKRRRKMGKRRRRKDRREAERRRKSSQARMSTHKRSLPFDFGRIDSELSYPLCVAGRKRRFIRSEVGVLPERSALYAGFSQCLVVHLDERGLRESELA